MLLKFKVLFVFLIVLSFSSQAQRVWTLSDCIQYAIDHNIQIKQQELNAEVADIRLTQSYYSLLPNLNGMIGGSYSEGRSVDPYTYEFTENNVSSTNFSLSSSVTLFSGFQKINTIKANKYSLLASLSDRDQMKNDISLSIITAYLNVLYASDLVETSKNQVELTKMQVNRTQTLFDNGSVPYGSLLEVKAQLAEEESQMLQAENQLDMARLTITQIMELRDEGEFAIAKPDVSELDEGILQFSIQSIYEQAVMNLPQVKAAQFRLQSAQMNYKVALGSYLPRLSASASLYTGYSNNRQRAAVEMLNVASQPIGYVNGDTVFSFPYTSPSIYYDDYPFGDQFRDNYYQSVSLSLSIPIFNNYQIRQGVKNSKISMLQSEYSLELVKNQLYKEIQQAYSDALASMEKYKASQKSFAASEESFRYIQQRFDAGLLSSLDFNNSKNQLRQVELQMLQSKYEYLFKIGILEYYLGKSVAGE